jgi:hypothetical protein
VNLEVAEVRADEARLHWRDLSDDVREALSGKLAGLWGSVADEEIFDALPVEKQQALLLFVSRFRMLELWHLVKRIINIYGEGGVGIEFTAWPMIESTLSRRKDFTRFLANHKGTSGGFYEKGRPEASLHFLYLNETQQKWYGHFDLYSPIHSPISALKHFSKEYLGQFKPDWRIIRERLKA